MKTQTHGADVIGDTHIGAALHLTQNKWATEIDAERFHDQCAIAAMQALIPIASRDANDAAIAMSAYILADAMLAERERRAKARKEGE